MWQHPDELSRVLDKKISAYLDRSEESGPLLSKLYAQNNLAESNYSFGGPTRQREITMSQVGIPQQKQTLFTQKKDKQDNSKPSNEVQPKPDLFPFARYQVKSKTELSGSKHTLSSEQPLEILNSPQTELNRKTASSNTRTSLDFKFTEESAPMPRTPSRAEISPPNKPELLTAKSILSLRREKQSFSPASLAFSRTPPKLDQIYTETVSENLELGSRVSLVFSDKPTEMENEPSKPELRLLNETSGNNNPAEMTPTTPSIDIQRVSGIMGFWKQESIKSSKSQDLGQGQKTTSKLINEGQNSIVNLKKFLLGPGKTTEVAIKTNNSLTHRPTVNEFLDSQPTQKNLASERKSMYNYNIQGASPATADTNFPDVALTTQMSETMKSSRSKSPVKQPTIARLKTLDSRELPKLVIQSPSNSSHQTRYMNSLGKKSPKGLTGKEKKKVFKHLRVSFATFANTMRIIKKRLRLRYLKNRKEVYKYDPKDDPPVIKVTSRNKELVKKRNKYCKEDKKFRERELVEIQEGSKVEYFDSSGFSSLFSTKHSIPVPPNGNDLQAGKVVKSGFVKKVTNKSKMHHSRWISLRSFSLYWYNSPSSLQPKGIVPLGTIPIKESFLDGSDNPCLVIEQARGRDFIFLSDNSWKVALQNEIAFKSYLEYMRENHIIPRTGVIEYFENEFCRTLDLSGLEINDAMLNKFIYESLAFHLKLKELNLSKTNVRGKQLEDLVNNLINLKKHSKLEALNLDGNGINKDSIRHITRYLESESSFNLKKFSMRYNPIGDEGIQYFMESVLNRFEKINVESKKKLVLPFSELDLTGTRTADQSIFTLIGVFDQINKRFVDSGVEDNKDLLTLKLADNLISNNGLRAFAKALTKFHGLKELDLSNNPRLTGVNFSILLTHLKQNSSLVSLDYKKNEIDLKGLATLFSNLADNFLLKRLTITLDEQMVESFFGNEEVITDFYKVSSENRL